MPCSSTRSCSHHPPSVLAQPHWESQGASSPVDHHHQLGPPAGYCLPQWLPAGGFKNILLPQYFMHQLTYQFPVDHPSLTSSFLRPLTTQGDPAADTISKRMKRRSKVSLETCSTREGRTGGVTGDKHHIWLALVFEGKMEPSISKPK